MRDIRTLKEKKKELGLTNQEVADLSGVPLSTVQKVFSGATRSPGSNTILAIERVLFPDKAASEQYTFESGSDENIAREAPAPYAGSAPAMPEGGYTYADYVALPDDRRVELIDGRFYDMAAPNSRHQIVLGELFVQLNNCVQEHPGCLVLFSPLDVMLDCDDRTVVQPDLIVLCDRSKMRKGRIFGAPDLVIEIVSPGSRRMDYLLKSTKYITAGVREYWIVDYEKRRVLIYRSEEEPDASLSRNEEKPDASPARNGEAPDELDVSIVGMDDDIPVGISGGSCVIQMGAIQELLDSFGDI